MADHITIGDVSPRIQYTGDGSQTAFTYPFPIFADADIEVYEDTTLKTLTTHYSVAGEGNSSGGTVTFVTAPATGVVVTLRRSMTIERTTDFQESGEFRAKVINDELDKETAFIQQINEDLTRSLRQSATDASGDMEIPDRDARKGKVLGFDATTGDPIVSTDDLTALEGAADSAAAAAVSETNAAASAAAAASSATSAASSSTAAAASATAASASASNAATSETNAATSASNAATSETNAATSATNASTSETNAAASASAAATSATNASASETNAATSASNASTSETNAATSASNASTSETNAAASAAAAAASAASGLYSAVQEKSANYTIVVGDAGDLIKVDASGGTVTITLDALATIGVDFRCAVQKVDSSANAVTVQRSSADTINGATSITIESQWELYDFIGDTSTGLWSAVNTVATGITGGDGIDKTGSVLSVDLAASNPGLEISGGQLQVDVDDSTIERAASGIQAKDGGITPAKVASQVKAFDMPFNAGFGVDYTGENLVVQTYGELVASRSGSFTGEAGYIDTVCTGSAVIVDIEKNGTTIYATKPQFAISTNALTAGVLKTDGTEDFVSGDRITFKVMQIGSTIAGQKLRFTVKAEVT